MLPELEAIAFWVPEGCNPIGNVCLRLTKLRHDTAILFDALLHLFDEIDFQIEAGMRQGIFFHMAGREDVEREFKRAEAEGSPTP